MILCAPALYMDIMIVSGVIANLLEKKIGTKRQRMQKRLEIFDFMYN